MYIPNKNCQYGRRWGALCAMYSASVLDNAIMYCFFKLQYTAPFPKWKEYPEMECRCFWPAQSASQYPWTRVVVRPPKVSHKSFVHLRYTITCLSASQCACPGFCINCERTPTAYAVLGCDTTSLQLAKVRFQRKGCLACALLGLELMALVLLRTELLTPLVWLHASNRWV